MSDYTGGNEKVSRLFATHYKESFRGGRDEMLLCCCCLASVRQVGCWCSVGGYEKKMKIFVAVSKMFL